MYRLWVLMALAGLLLRADLSQSVRPSVGSDCGFADHEDLHFLCQNEITGKFESDWGKVSPPIGTPYSIWQTNHGLIIMAAFYDVVLYKYDTIMVDPSGARIEGKYQYGDYFSVPMPQSQIFCYNSEIPFISALLHICLGQDHKLKDPRHSILHFASPKGYYVDGANMLTSVMMLTLLTALLAAFANPTHM